MQPRRELTQGRSAAPNRAATRRAARYQVALCALAFALASCASPSYGPQRTELPQDGAAVLPCRQSRGTFFLFAEFPGQRGRHAFLFDTGTDRTLLDLPFAHALGLKALDDEPVMTATGDAVPGALLERIPTMRLGEATFHDVDCVGLDLSNLREEGGLPIVGIIGCDLFRQCLLEIDYRSRSLRALPRNAAPTAPAYAFEERSPFVDASFAGTNVRVLVDTGFLQTVALPPGSAVPFVEPPRPYGEIASISGTEPKEVARLDGTLRIGDLSWRDPQILLVPGCPKIGTRLLRDSLIHLDASGGKIWIQRSR